MTTTALTDAGWPRPVIDGWPIPWVSPPEDLSFTDGDRLLAVIAGKLCQVCGLGHQPGDRIIVYVSADNEGTGRDVDLADQTVFAMDNAILHDRCARLALARCPALREMKRNGALIVLSAPAESLFVGDANGKGDDHLAVPGAAATIEG